MGKYFLFKFSAFFFGLIREHRNIHIFIYALTSRFVQRLSDSRSVPGCLALPMNICWRCLSVVLALKHLACTTRQQPEPRWQLNRLIISTQNSDVPHKHCGATLAFSLGIAEDVGQESWLSTGPDAVLGVQMESCSYRLDFGGNKA